MPAIAGGAPTRPPERPLIFARPVMGEAEVASVSDCLRSRWIGPGPRVARFEQEFASYKQAPYAAAVSSGTAAIHLALVALGIGKGDEVIAPTMTFCSTIHSILRAGATPVLVDNLRTTFNMDPAAAERHVTSRTRAILVVHMCGRCCEMDPILKLARRRRLHIIEDCAHAIESSYHGQPAGLMGDAGCFSFDPAKHITTGDGGMVITRDQRLFRRIKTLSLQGMSADAWSRSVGGKNSYKVVEAGFKYNMTDIAASVGLPQFSQLGDRWLRREKIWRLYEEGLKDLPLLLPPPPEPNTRHAFHLFSPLLVLEKLAVDRDQVMAALRAEHIGAGVHYVPVHLQPYYRRRFGFRTSDFPNAAFVGKRTISLPLSPEMSDEDVSDVCAALRRVLGYYGSGAKAAGRVSKRNN